MPILSYKEIQEKTDEELIALYDEQASRTEVSMSFLRDEMQRREMSKQQSQVWWMTFSVVVLTVVYTATSIVQLWKMYHP